MFLCRGADKRWTLFRLSFDVPHMQTADKHNVLEPAENIGVSLEPWALLVNIVVSEIEQKTILQFKPLNMKKSLPQTMLTNHITPLNVCLLKDCV